MRKIVYSVCLRPEQIDWLKKQAAKTLKSVGQVIRELVDEKLKGVKR